MCHELTHRPVNLHLRLARERVLSIVERCMDRHLFYPNSSLTHAVDVSCCAFTTVTPTSDT